MAKRKTEKDDIRALKDARRALRELGNRQQRAGITEETEEYLRLNQAVINAEKAVSWWRRGAGMLDD